MTSLRPLLLLALLLLPAVAAAQGSRHYDAQGRYIGRSETSGATTRHYDAQGRYQGRAEQGGTRQPGHAGAGGGGTLRFYDAQGRYQGRAEGGRRYDATGRYLGRTESR